MTQESTHRFGHQPDHEHYTLLYESQEDQFASIIPFLKEGLERGEQCLYLAHENSPDEIAADLREQGVDVEDAMDSGQLSVRHAHEIYLSDGTFDPDRMVDRLERKASEATDAGYDRFRIAAETSWVLDYDVDLDLLERYERQIDAVIEAEPLVGLCQYSRSRFSTERLCRVLRVHPQVMQNATLGLNCYYGLTDDQIDDGSNPVDRRLKTIQQQKRVTDTLRERERCLSLLGQSTKQLREAGSGEIERIAAEIISEIVSPSQISFYQYDEDTGELQSRTVQDTLDGVETEGLSTDIRTRAWESFAENEKQVSTVEASESLTEMLFPVGQHGVFLIRTPQTDTMAESDTDFIRSICGHTEAVLDQIEYERDLERRNEQLTEEKADLERINKINAVIREVSQSLVDATTQEEIKNEVCELLVAESCASFAWYGTYDSVTETLDPERTAGDDQGYLDALLFEDDWTTSEPSGRAARTHETTVVQNIYDSPPLDHWRKQALNRDFQSAIALPVSFDDSMYGVLSLYSDTIQAFDDEVVSVLEELSNLIAHAINSIQRKRALLTERVTELEVRITDTDVSVVEFVTRTGCRINITEIFSTDNGETRVLATFHNSSPEEIRAFARASPAVDTLNMLSEGDGTHTCEYIITDRCLIANSLNHNVVPQSIRIEDGEARVVLHLPGEKRIREFMEMFTTKYPGAEVVSRRDLEQHLQRISEIEAALNERLTDRQLEVLQLAFHSGYFERPRQRTAEEIAATLGVSHPTVSRHLREAERKIFSLLLEDAPP